MSDEVKKISDLPSTSNVKTTDLLVVAIANNSNAAVFETRKATVGTLFANVTSNSITVTKTTIPSNNNSLAAPVGQFWFANGYMYVVSANNRVQRVQLSDY